MKAQEPKQATIQRDLATDLGELSTLRFQRSQREAALQVEIAKLKKPIDELTDKITELEKAIYDWAHQPEIKAKLVETPQSNPFGEVGFSKGFPKVALLKGWTEEKAIAALDKIKSLAKYVRRTPEINRKLIQEELKKEKLNFKAIAKAGLTIERPPRFYLELASEKKK